MPNTTNLSTSTPWPRALRVGWLLVVAVSIAWSTILLPARGDAAGIVIDAPDRVDALYDGVRDAVYISTSTGELLRYDVASQSFLSPLSLSNVGLFGIAISPDGSKLAVADRAYSGTPRGTPLGENWIHVVDLDRWTARTIRFERSRGEVGTYMVEFLDDATLAVTSSFSGSGWVPMRRVDIVSGLAQQMASVRQSSMLSMAADGSRLAYAESNISSGEFGLYDPAAQTFDESGTGWFAFEIAVNRDGTQVSVPSYNGTYVYDETLSEIDRIGIYARTSPIGVAYDPDDDIVYQAWWGTNEGVQAYDSNTLTLLGIVDDELTFDSTGNGAFRHGRLRVAQDGSGLSVTMDGGVKLYAPIAFVDDDPDEDGVRNRTDNCPNTPNPGQEDTDANGIGDACNDGQDADRDEHADALDNCPNVANPTQADVDGNRIGDDCNDFEDIDGDDWADHLDNCPDDANDQVDRDGDGQGDACDLFPDRTDHPLAQCETDLAVATARIQELEAELAMCVMPNDDADGDGVPDDVDRCPETPAKAVTDPSGCSRDQFCRAIEIDGLRSLVACSRARWGGDAGARRRGGRSCGFAFEGGFVCVER